MSAMGHKQTRPHVTESGMSALPPKADKDWHVRFVPFNFASQRIDAVCRYPAAHFKQRLRCP